MHQAAQAPPPSTSPALERIFYRANRPVTEEHDVPLEVIEGAVPAALRGVHFRNGPGRQEAFGVPYEHPFDGDGMITRFAFDGSDAPVRYRNRFVRTREFEAEAQAGRMLYRAFGTNLPGGLRTNLLRMTFKNAANTSIVQHGQRLLALWEGGLPHRLDPDTLETLGRESFGGLLSNQRSLIDRVLMPELPFSAHPSVDPRTGELWNFGVAYGGKPRLMLYRIDADGRCQPPQSVVLDRMSFVHDFVLTDRWRIFFLTPVSFDVPRTLVGLKTPVESLAEAPGVPMEILLVPRDGGPSHKLQAKAGFIFHFTGGHDINGHTVAVDGYRMDHMPDAASARRVMAGQPIEYPTPILTRYTLDLRTQTVTETALCALPGELPTIHPDLQGRPYQYAWCVALAAERPPTLFTAIGKVDVTTGQHIHRDFYPDLPGEPLFVPRPSATDEDDGWLLTLIYRAEDHRSELLILDARDLSTVCRLALPHHVPPGFHSTWCPAPQ